MNGPLGIPKVTSNVQTPMYFARSFLKYVSITTALPMASRKFQLTSQWSHMILIHTRCRRDEKRLQSSTSSRGGIIGTVRTTHVADKTAYQRKEENRATTISIRQWLPEQGRTSEDGDLEGCQVTGFLHGNPIFFGDAVRGH